MNVTKGKRIWGILALILTSIIFIGASIIVGIPLVQFAKEPEKFRAIVEESGFLSRIICIVMLIIQTVLALIPGEPFEILSGYAFGLWEGTFLCILSSAIGSIIVFLISRKLGKKFVEIFFSKEKIDSLHILNDNKKMYYLIFILFFIPGTPKDLLTYVAGLTQIKLFPYILITSIAKIPSVITSTIGGDAFGEKKYLYAFIVFVLTGLISIVGLIIYNKITKKK